jgi:hypothetical protein
MLVVFVFGALISEKLYKKQEIETMTEKALNYSK